MTENKESWLLPIIAKAVNALYETNLETTDLSFQKTRKEFPGDITLVCFPLTRISKKKPDVTAAEIGEAITQSDARVLGFNVVNGFLNIELTFAYWIDYLHNFSPEVSSSHVNTSKVMIEYSSPNTNKPLHLGHIRNNLLGFSVSRILQERGHDVKKVNLINDRGIHICKSMLAWIKSGKQESPESTGLKGDHLVGKYYVLFDSMLREESKIWKDRLESGDTVNMDAAFVEKAKVLLETIATSIDEEKTKAAQSDLKLLINNQTELMKEAQQMLRDWEEGKQEVISLWKQMNAWVYEGFNKTYERMGVSFDKFYYESNTYILGKDIVQKGLESGVLFKKEDGSVWIDLQDAGLDQKLLLRSDGTSVYMTQDLGTAVVRNEELGCKSYIYVVGNEQDYHFNVLKLILQRLGYSWADGIYHLSYGMVDLPSGRMKSREGTVVDADDLIEEVISEAKARSLELGKTQEMSHEEQHKLFETLGLGALKYYILKVDPRKRMVFNPEESIDLQGNTGPFVQYTYARIQSLSQKAGSLKNIDIVASQIADEKSHRGLIRQLEAYSEMISQAADQYSPALVANYMYELAKEYNSFYHDFPILKEENVQLAAFRLKIATQTGLALKRCAYLLGMEMPDRM